MVGVDQNVWLMEKLKLKITAFNPVATKEDASIICQKEPSTFVMMRSVEALIERSLPTVADSYAAIKSV